jgi:hypothetical protein
MNHRNKFFWSIRWWRCCHKGVGVPSDHVSGNWDLNLSHPVTHHTWNIPMSLSNMSYQPLTGVHIPSKFTEKLNCVSRFETPSDGDDMHFIKEPRDTTISHPIILVETCSYYLFYVRPQTWGLNLYSFPFIVLPKGIPKIDVSNCGSSHTSRLIGVPKFTVSGSPKFDQRHVAWILSSTFKGPLSVMLGSGAILAKYQFQGGALSLTTKLCAWAVNRFSYWHKIFLCAKVHKIIGSTSQPSRYVCI